MNGQKAFFISGILLAAFGLVLVKHLGKSYFIEILVLSLVLLLVSGFIGRKKEKSKNETKVIEHTQNVIFDNVQITYTRTIDDYSETILWEDLTEIFIVAEDAFPIGNIYWGLRGSGNNGCAIPWNTEGSNKLLHEMQLKLPGFDNQAVIEASGMLDGIVCLWKKGEGNA